MFGLVAWLLHVLRLDDETRMQVTATTLSIRRASLQGQNLTAIPLSQVGSTSCGFRKPLGLLAIGIFIAAGGLLSLLGTLLDALPLLGRERFPALGPAQQRLLLLGWHALPAAAELAEHALLLGRQLLPRHPAAGRALRIGVSERRQRGHREQRRARREPSSPRECGHQPAPLAGSPCDASHL